MKVQLSNKRRATYYKDSEIDSLPIKYQGPRFSYKKGVLVNLDTKKPVIRNASVAGKPRFTPISGNALYTGMHERIRIAIITGIKRAFLPHLPNISVGAVLEYPVSVHMDIYRTVGDGMWDLDNFVILYFKAFHDLLKEEGKIPDDSIQFISKTSSAFHPIGLDKLPEMVFTLTSDIRPEIQNNLFYHNAQHMIVEGRGKWEIVISEKANAGEMMIDVDKHTFFIGIGKKHILWNAVQKVFNSIARYLIIMNSDVEVSKEMGEVLGKELKERLSSQSIQVKINSDKHISEWVQKLFTKTLHNGKSI